MDILTAAGRFVNKIFLISLMKIKYILENIEIQQIFIIMNASISGLWTSRKLTKGQLPHTKSECPFHGALPRKDTR